MSYIKTKLKDFFVFIRLVDPFDGNLSLTNIGLIIVLVKLAVVQQASLTDISALFLALISYQSKKIINKQVAIDSLKSVSNIISAVTKTGEEIAKKEQDLNVNS